MPTFPQAPGSFSKVHPLFDYEDTHYKVKATAASDVGSSGRTFSLSYPAGTATGDLLYLFLACTGAQPATPAGWTYRGGAQFTTPHTQSVFFYTRSAESATGSVTVAPNGGPNQAVICALSITTLPTPQTTGTHQSGALNTGTTLNHSQPANPGYVYLSFALAFAAKGVNDVTATNPSFVHNHPGQKRVQQVHRSAVFSIDCIRYGQGSYQTYSTTMSWASAYPTAMTIDVGHPSTRRAAAPQWTPGSGSPTYPAAIEPFYGAWLELTPSAPIATRALSLTTAPHSASTISRGKWMQIGAGLAGAERVIAQIADNYRGTNSYGLNEPSKDFLVYLPPQPAGTRLAFRGALHPGMPAGNPEISSSGFISAADTTFNYTLYATLLG